MADKITDPRDISLEVFLSNQLKASTLSINSINNNELVVESNSIVRIHVAIDDSKKMIGFDVFSPRWSRRIMVQQLGGFDFMESQAEEELEKEDADNIAEDAVLALDMIRYWARVNNYEATEVAPSPDGYQNRDAGVSIEKHEEEEEGQEQREPPQQQRRPGPRKGSS